MFVPGRHYSTTIILHWLSFLLLVVALSCVLIREFVEDDDLRALLIMAHKSAGFSFLWLSLLRIGARLMRYSNGALDQLPKATQTVAKISHLIIYVLLIVVPLSGWLFSSAAGKPINFLNLVIIPNLMAKHRELAEKLGEVHEVLAWGLVIFIGLHISAALWHHFIKRDGVLLSMTFLKRTRQGSES